MGDITKDFSVKEFEKSSTADKLKINNEIPNELFSNIRALAFELQKLRNEFGDSITITSGYRCDKLNKAVGGSPTSSHVYGLAADIKPKNGDMKKLQEIAIRLVNSGILKIDQLIIEKPINGIATWLHIGVGPKMRGAILTIK